MPYEVRYSDEANKGVILVEDNLINVETSMQLPGKRATGYGKAVAENFLHLLENFASPNEPLTPVEGQLWYDTGGSESQLKIYDSTQWKTASGFTKSAARPTASQSTAGDLWVDTTNQQLFVYTGAAWVLIGPETSLGLLTGGRKEEIITTTEETVEIFTLFVEGVPYAILSSENFTPKAKIDGFSAISKGLNIRDETPFEENNPIKFQGVAEKAKSLVVTTATGSQNVPAENFIRTDAAGTMEQQLRVKTNDGIKIGSEDHLNVKVLTGETDSIQFIASKNASNINFSLRDGDRFNDVLTVASNGTFGVNNTSPDEALHVVGNVKVSPITDDPTSGVMTIENISSSTDINSGSIVVAGGVGIAENLNVGNNVTIAGTTTVSNNFLPATTESLNIGSDTNLFNDVHALRFKGSLEGDVTGTVNGTADRANRLANATTFSVSGDVEAPSFDFDGSTGEEKTFNISIKNTFIASRDAIANVAGTDELLINVTSGNTGVRRVTKNDFIKTVPITPIGSILPFGGNTAPEGWLICNGEIVNKSAYSQLWSVIGHNFLDPTLLSDGGSATFALPDMRGRMPLGVDNMGGTPANRVTSSVQSFTNLQGINTIGTGSNAVFSVQTSEGNYAVQVTNPGQNYKVGDTITISGIIFGGASPAHDLIITVDSIQANGIKTFTIQGTAFTGIGADKIGASLGNQAAEIELKNLPEHEHKLSKNNSQYYAIAQKSEDPNNPGELLEDPNADSISIESGTSGFEGILNSGGVNTSAGLSVPLNVMNPYLSLNYIIYYGEVSE